MITLMVYHFVGTGTIIRRHRIPKPPPNDNDYYTVEDFNIAKEITMYSRVFKITNCDDFTHNFLRKLGVRLNQPEPIPHDPHTVQRTMVGHQSP